MGKQTTPAVLIVDDNPDAYGRALAKELGLAKLRTKPLHPEDVTHADLISADVVLVDYELDRWPQRDRRSVSCQPVDGLALSALLRRHILEARSAPTAFAIFTGQMGALAEPFPPHNRAHTLAKMNGLEWVFEKGAPPVAQQVIALAHAVQALPKAWSGQVIDIREWLGINGTDGLAERYLEQAAACNPPIHELSKWSHGVAVVRWFLQSILPYPCFLWDTRRLAMRLRVEHGWLIRALDKEPKLARALCTYEYRGSLKGFLGPRWWRAGIEYFLWEITGGRAVDPKAVREALGRYTKKHAIKPLAVEDPVLCVDRNYAPDGCFPQSQAVRVRPDDWPAFAEQAWMTIADVKGDKALRALVVPDDQERVL